MPHRRGADGAAGVHAGGGAGAVCRLFAMGANVAGALDILVGALATGAAALLTRKWRHVRLRGLPVLSTLPPVVLNALVVGLELTVALYGWDARLYAINALAVGAGELISATGGGLILYIALRGRLNGEKR